MKTGGLIFLVAVSLMLTGQLWFNIRYAGSEIERPATLVGLVPGDRAGPRVQPLRIIVHYGEDRHSALKPGNREFDALWAATGRLLAAYGRGRLPGDSVESSPVELARWRRDTTGVEVMLPFAQDLPGWLDLLAAENRDAGATRQDNRAINRLAMFLDGPDLVFLLGGQNMVGVRVRPGDLDAARGEFTASSLRDLVHRLDGAEPASYRELRGAEAGVGVAPGTYVPAVVPALPMVLTSAPPYRPEDLAWSFFGDRGAVRKFEESDGARVYTDGRRGSRVYSSGAVDFIFPRDAQGPLQMAPAAAVKKAGDFVGGHGGWPNGSFLYDLKPYYAQGSFNLQTGAERSGYIAQFGIFHHGYPVLGQDAPIEVRLNEQGVVYYGRLARAPDDREVLSFVGISAEAALQALVDGWPPLYRRSLGDVTVVDMFLAYYSGRRDARVYLFRPVWTVVLDDGTVAFVDAQSGTLYGKT